MEEIQVRIVTLEPLRAICLNGFGSEPEMQAWNKLVAWAQAHGLWQDGQPRRFFGYNNPSPSAGSPNYGYDTWLVVGPEVQPDGEARLIEFPGGLYAVTRCQGVENIAATWHRMVGWLEQSPYRHGSHQWLEEHLSTPELTGGDFILDLYLPLSE